VQKFTAQILAKEKAPPAQAEDAMSSTSAKHPHPHNIQHEPMSWNVANGMSQDVLRFGRVLGRQRKRAFRVITSASHNISVINDNLLSSATNSRRPVFPVSSSPSHSSLLQP
jgi:hypothetical protein